MTRGRRKIRPIKFTLRLYPGQDDDLICWLDELDGEQIGTKTRAMKEALRSGKDTGKAEAVRGTSATPPLDPVEIRQVVEAAVASAVIFGKKSEALALLGKSTAYIKRSNLTSRLFNGRQVRKTLAFSSSFSCWWELGS